MQSALSIEFPKSMKSLFQKHNGQRRDCGCGPYYGMIMLSLEEIESQWQSNREVQRELELMPDLEPDTDLQSASPSKVKPGYQRQQRANYKFGNDELTKYVLGESFDEFISWYMQQLSSGNYLIATEEYGDGEESLHRFDPKQPEKTHFLDALSHWF